MKLKLFAANFFFAASMLVLFGAGANDENAPSGYDQPRSVPKGQVITETYASKTLGVERKLMVYTPPGFDRSKKYPVLYLLHGAGDDETGWLQKGSANVILDNLYAGEKTIAPMIVVMPNGFTRRPGDTPLGRDAPFEARRQLVNRFESEVLDDIIPLIEKRYPVIADSNHRALAGLSMGGSQTMRIGPTHPETFAYLGVFSSGMRRDRTQPSPEDNSSSYPDAKKLNSALKLFWVSCGDRDRVLEAAKVYDQFLTEKNINHVWHLDSGGHEWPVWKNDLYLVAQRLFRE